jgi:hypothetical protein
MSTRSTYDPFGWRLEDLADPDLNPLRRAELLDELLIAEAEELATGRRHLTIVHGEPADLAEVEDLNDFYDAVSEIVEDAEWSRLAGGATHLTVAVAGRGRDEVLTRVLDRAARESSGVWRLVDAPTPTW